MGDSVIEEAMMASSLMDGSIIDGNYDAYTDMSSFSANLCDVVQEDEMGMYGTPEDQEVYLNRSKRLICKRCGKAFRNKLLLKKHMAMHGKDLLFECEQCLKKFSRKESLTRHQLVHSGMKFFECQECGRMFNQNGHLRTHMLIHTKEKSYECDQCDMKFARKDNMKRHSLRHETKKKFECNVCLKRFSQHGHLESHMLVHTKEKNFECEECFMKFARRDTLKRHMLVHSKEKTYECESCLAKFIQNSHLKAHILVHTKEKRFRCTDCDKRFARKGSLKRHMLVHTGERNFECSECGKTFIQKTHLNKHQMIHSGAKEKMSEEHVDEFIENITKVEVHIQHMNSTKNGSASSGKKGKSAPKSTAAKNNASTENVKTENVSTNTSQIPPQGATTPCLPKVSTVTSKNVTHTPTVSTVQQPNSQQPVVSNGMQQQHQQQQQQQQQQQHQQQVSSQQSYNKAGGVPQKLMNPGNPDESQMQSNNLLANSNSVMALALLDHFLTGNEAQDNVAAHEAAAAAAAKNRNGNNQWGQKTHQELLAAQTLSAIGQRGSVPNETHQAYAQASFVGPQVSACNLQPVSQGVLASGPAAMKIRPPTNMQWMPQDKAIMHPQNVVYNVPPPAHEIFRYYSPTSMPLPHHANRLPDGSCIPADMRASPRKPKYPQKVVLPSGEWQTTLPMHMGNMNPNIPMYAHSKHPAEIPRMLDKP